MQESKTWMFGVCTILSATACLLAAAPVGASQQAATSQPAPRAVITAGSGSFVLPGGAGRERRVLTVHYHHPANLTRDSPVLIVLPGAGRDGDEYRDSWREASERYGVLILSPSYSETHYPGFWSYNLANMVDSLTMDVRLTLDTNPPEWQFGDVVAAAADDSGLERLAHADRRVHRIAMLALAGMVTEVDGTSAGLTVNRDRGAWIFSDFERIFDTARDTLDLEARSYDMFGHSAGGQVLHRFALFHSGHRADRMLAANSGWYTLPDFEAAFPYGLGNTGMQVDEVRQSLQSRLIVLLGEQDDENETRGSLRRTPEADRQGPGRLQRGHYFMDQARTLAREFGVDLGWSVEVVPGVGHDSHGMGVAAAEYLYAGEKGDGGD